MRIDSEKLEQHIDSGLVATHGCCLTESVVIGEIDGRQIILSVTKDEDFVFEDVNDEFICIEYP